MSEYWSQAPRSTTFHLKFLLWKWSVTSVLLLSGPPTIPTQKGELDGLILAEAAFETPDLLTAFPMPDFAMREVTDDPRFTGGYLVKNGPPTDFN